MKINLFSTLTNQKINALLLFAMLGSQQTKAGLQFSKCLSDSSIVNPYDSIIEFVNVSNVVDKQLFCCDASYPFPCSPLSSPCPYSTYLQCQCNKVGKSRFCITKGPDYGSQIELPSDLCGGILGDTISINAVIGDCPAPSTVSNSLTVTSLFGWLCCNKDSCSLATDVKIIENTANTNCLPNQWSMMCFQDNEGWSCTGSISSNIEDISRPMGSCILQASPNAKSETITSSLSATSSASGFPASPITSPNNQPSNDPNLTEKIAIPIGTVVGVVTIGGITYYAIRKRKNKNATNPPAQERTDVELVNLPQRNESTLHPSEIGSHEVVASSSQSQPRAEEENKQLKEEMQKLKQRLERMEKSMEQDQKAQIEQPPK